MRLRIEPRSTEDTEFSLSLISISVLSVVRASDQQPFELALQRAVAGDAGHAIHFLPAFEVDQSRDAHDAVARQDLGVVVGVEFCHQRLALVFSGEIGDRRRDGVARAAPLAQKSTTAGISDWSTTASNSSPVT